MKLLQKYSLLGFIALLFIACDDPAIQPAEEGPLGTEYYPLELAYQNSYQVTKTIYKLNEPTETQRFQRKEVVSETFTTEGGETAYKLLRYTRQDVFDNWQLDSIWSVRSSQNFIIKTEQATPFAKLAFPLEEGLRWDGNIFNGKAPELYTLENLDQAHTLAGTDYPRTLRILQRQDSSLVNKFTSEEMYAAQVGLIYKKTENLIFCNNPQEPECFGLGLIERGEIVEEVLFERGKEE